MARHSGIPLMRVVCYLPDYFLFGKKPTSKLLFFGSIFYSFKIFVAGIVETDWNDIPCFRSVPIDRGGVGCQLNVRWAFSSAANLFESRVTSTTPDVGSRRFSADR